MAISLYHHPHVVTFKKAGKVDRIALRATRNDAAQKSVIVAFIVVRPNGKYLIKMQVKHDDKLRRDCIDRVKMRYRVAKAKNIVFVPQQEKS
jgi:hypothetical protein